MTTLDNVSHLPALPAAELLKEHILPERPVVFTDLFAGDPITELTRDSAVRAHLGSLRLRTRLNYYSSGLVEEGDAPDEPAETWDQSLNEYLEYVAENPNTRRCSVEFMTPPELRGLFSMPALCRDLEGLPDDVLSLLFVANRGNSAHLHFDCDHRHVLLHQLLGVKRVMVIPPSVGRKVLPFGSFGGLVIEEMAPDEKARLAAYLGAYDTLLKPGETLFIPALAWHYVDYVETGMSVSLRFGRRDLDKLIAEDVFHDMYVQNVGALALRSGLNEDAEHAIRAAIARAYASPAEKYQALKGLFAQLFYQLCPGAFRGRYAVPANDRLEERLGVRFYQDAQRAGGADAWRGTPRAEVAR